MEDYAPSDTEMIWPQRNVAIDQAPNHLPLVYLEVSLSNFTKKLLGPEESKQRQETKIDLCKVFCCEVFCSSLVPELP